MAAIAASADPGTALPAQRPTAIRVVLDDNFPPFTMRDASGQLRGLLPDRWKAWEAHTGVRVELLGMDWAKAQERMQAGGAEVIDTISRTPARESLYDFAPAYAGLDVMLFFRSHLSGIVDAASASGFEVGVKQGDRCAAYLQDAGVSRVRLYPSYQHLIRAAASQEVSVFCMNQRPADYLLGEAGLGEAFRHTPAMYNSQLHWAVRKGDAATLALVQAGFDAMGPAHWKALELKWFGAPVEGDRSEYLHLVGSVLLGFLLVVALLLGWVYSMRRAVRAKTVALEQERARFEALFQTLPDPVWLKGVNGTVLDCNTAYEQLMGRSRRDILGQSDQSLLGDEMARQFLRSDETAMLSDAPLRFEEWLTLPGGAASRLYLISKTRMHDAHGTLLGVLGMARDVTELHQSEERFRRLFEGTRQPIMLVEDGHFVAANQASLDILRMQHLDQFLGKSPEDISPEYQPDGRRSQEKVAEVIVTAFEHGSHEFEWEHIRADGEHFMARVLLTPIRQGDKDLLHVAWSDITRQKQAERALEEYRQSLEQKVRERTQELTLATASLNESNERLQAILDGAHAGIMLVRHRVIQQCNRRLETMLGYAHGELDGVSTLQLYADPADWDRVGQQLYVTLSKGEPFLGEYAMRRKDGGLIWIRLSAVALEIDDIDRKGIVVMLEDITAGREAADALAKAQQEQQAVFNAATVGVILTRDRVILQCNRTMEQLFGYGPGELVGQTTRVLYPDDATYEGLSARLVQGMQEQGRYREERELVRKDGTRFWCRKMVQAIDQEALDKGFAGTFEDISDERAARDAMEHARVLAEDAARTKSDFLANMSHEIRTPMNSIMGMATLALKAEPPPKVRDYVNKILASSQHLLGVINDILDFSKIEAHKLALEQVDFDLEKVLDDLATLVSDKASAKGLELVFGMGRGVPRYLQGDPLRLEQVLINLTNNALKFTAQGEISVRVSLLGQREDGVMLRFAVRDSGIGITEQQKAKLFQSFQQGDTSTTRRFGGTGLGLAISRHLVELMGGEIGVDSEPGVGSTFWFQVPLAVSTTAMETRQIRPDLRGLRVLAVDDNPQACEVIEETLAAMGFQVTAVQSGALALEHLKQADDTQRPFDIVFLDWKMPGMSGIEVAQAIGQRPWHKAPMVLMVTAYDVDEVRPLASAVGIHEVLVKPATPSSLLDALMREVGHAPSAPPPSAADAAQDALHALPALQGRRVLLVEDNDMNQEVATEFLKALGLVVDLAVDGAQAVERVQAHSYDVVLMDMQMPVMDGLEATRAIRRIGALDGLPILAMTANAMAVDRERCMAAGMNDHIAKPIDPGILARKLVQWVRPAEQWHAPHGNRGEDGAASVALSSRNAVEALPAALNAVVGLNPSLGLRQAGGRVSLYLRVLDRFLLAPQELLQPLQRALQELRWADAQRMAHTLKGVSAQAGAMEVHDLAAQLEAALQPATASAQSHTAAVQALAHALGAVLDSLTVALGAGSLNAAEAAAPSAGVSVDLQAWPAAREQWLALLRTDDLEAQHWLEAHEPLAKAALGSGFKPVAAAVRDFDFAEALRLVEAAAGDA